MTRTVTLENLLLISIAPTIGGIATLVAAIIGARTAKRSEVKLHAIDNAVNGRRSSDHTMSEDVQELIDRPQPGEAT
jgi:hypothetical protein